MLTQELLRELFDYRDGTLYWTRPEYPYMPNYEKETGPALTAQGYKTVNIRGTTFLQHRLIWMWHHGEMPSMLDHINGDRTDNRLENLREATASQNGANSKKKGKGRFKGVTPCKITGKYKAQIMFKYKNHALGRFDTEVEAAQAYNLAAWYFFGDYAGYNSGPEYWF